jgi:cyanophycinase
MITGNSKRDTISSTALKGIWTGSVEYAEGLCLLDSVVIDQHFVVRSRYNRMLSGLLDHTRYQFVGINESTAVIVRGQEAVVTGESQVIVMEQPQRIRRLKQGDTGAQRIQLSVYLPGDRFRLKR